MSWTEPEFGTVAELLTDEFGVTFPPARRIFAEAAMRRAISSARERNVVTYLERLRAEPALLRTLIGEVTIGETYFFRDVEQFDVIRTTVLPDIARRRGAGTPLRIWSAGCSTGEEPYSLAILLDECGLGERTVLLATDVSSTSIETARRGQYGAWSFRRDVASWRERCFVRSGKRWSIAPAFRRIEFVVHNLMQPAPASIISAGGFDLIVCRNVLLYFDRKTVERATHLLADALAPGGWLLMSPTDPPPPDDLGLETVLTPAGIAFRRPLGAAQPAPVAQPPVIEAAPAIAQLPKPRVKATPRRAPARLYIDAETYVARALNFLDSSQPHQAAASARRALFLDRSLAVAHLTLARALRLTGSRSAAQRALRRGTALLETHAPEDTVRFAGGASAGTLSAVAAAEFDLLVGTPS
jgi:chemotaxis protein methyltransferase CheR